MDVSFPDALRMISLTPATILGVADRKGSLEVGKDADIVILDADQHVTHTIVAGRICELEGQLREPPKMRNGWH
jgi:N-acetylglucosamine-6-phosphate deacetylase